MLILVIVITIVIVIVIVIVITITIIVVSIIHIVIIIVIVIINISCMISSYIHINNVILWPGDWPRLLVAPRRHGQDWGPHDILAIVYP